MREYKECYIAFLDLLGFKNTVNNEACETIASFFDEIQHEYIVTVNETGLPLMDYSKITRKVMSDTICFYVDATVKNALAGLVSVCDYFQVRMLRLSKPILVRGAIVRDQIYAHGDVTFGPGVSKAYLLEEKTAKYPRVIFTKSLFDNSSESDVEGRKYLSEYTFHDDDGFCAVDYLYLFYGLDHENARWKDFARSVQKALDSETDTSIREKYLYIDKNIARMRKKYNPIKSESIHA